MLEWFKWIGERLVQVWDASEPKDIVTTAGIVITFLFSCLNFWRTSQALKGTKANNRAGRFEVVHGPTLNEAVKEINEIGREISLAKISLVNVDEAKDLFRDKIRPRVIKAEHMVVEEIVRISASTLAKDKDAWKSVSKDSNWDDVNATSAVFLAVSKLDEAIAHFEKIKMSLAKITESIEQVRGAENEI